MAATRAFSTASVLYRRTCLKASTDLPGVAARRGGVLEAAQAFTLATIWSRVMFGLAALRLEMQETNISVGLGESQRGLYPPANLVDLSLCDLEYVRDVPRAACLELVGDDRAAE